MVETTYLRMAARADAAALARLRCASLRELGLISAEAGAALEPRAQCELFDAFDTGMLAGWLLVADGRVVGAALALFWRRLPYAETSLHAELAGVYVEPGFRRHGFARELCRETIAAARARGVRRIVVHPAGVARDFYRELGFNAGNEMRLE
jgi:GNAT superfamily N-acetyltransferase